MSGLFPENLKSDWSYGWECEGDGPIYTYKNWLQFKKDFPRYVKESEAAVEK